MVGTEPNKPTYAQPSERQTGDGGQPAQDKSLSKKSPENALWRRAESRAQCNLAPSVAGARQQQLGDVGAADQQYESSAGEESEQGGPYFAHRVAMQRDHVKTNVFLRECRVCAPNLRRHGVHILLHPR